MTGGGCSKRPFMGSAQPGGLHGVIRACQLCTGSALPWAPHGVGPGERRAWGGPFPGSQALRFRASKAGRVARVSLATSTMP